MTGIDATTADTDVAFVDFKDVWLAYSEELEAKHEFAVENINLKTRDGEFIAIVGPSGCGSRPAGTSGSTATRSTGR